MRNAQIWPNTGSFERYKVGVPRKCKILEEKIGPKIQGSPLQKHSSSFLSDLSLAILSAELLELTKCHCYLIKFSDGELILPTLHQWFLSVRTDYNNEWLTLDRNLLVYRRDGRFWAFYTGFSFQNFTIFWLIVFVPSITPYIYSSFKISSRLLLFFVSLH